MSRFESLCERGWICGILCAIMCMYSRHEGSVARKLDQQHITSLCKPPVDWELG